MLDATEAVEGAMAWRIDRLRAQLGDAVAEYDRLRAEPAPPRGELERLLAAIDVQLDGWLELLGYAFEGGALTAERRAIVARALLQLAVLRSRALALDLDRDERA